MYFTFYGTDLMKLKIGRSSLLPFDIKTSPSKRIELNRNVTRSIFGYPISSENIVIKEIDIHKDYKMLPSEMIATEGNPTNYIKFQLLMEFTEKITEVSYYTIIDVFSEFGGLFASFKAVYSNLSIFFFIYFMYQIS